MRDIYVGKFTSVADVLVNVECGFVPDCVMFVEATVPSLAVSFVDSTNGVNVTTAAAAPTDFVDAYAGAGQNENIRGTMAGTAGLTTVTGTSSYFTLDLKVGEHIVISGVAYQIAAIASSTSLTVASALQGTVSGVTAQRLEGRSPGFTLTAAHEACTTGEIDFIAFRGDGR
jgi:hypothetical protein